MDHKGDDDVITANSTQTHTQCHDHLNKHKRFATLGRTTRRMRDLPLKWATTAVWTKRTIGGNGATWIPAPLRLARLPVCLVRSNAHLNAKWAKMRWR